MKLFVAMVGLTCTMLALDVALRLLDGREGGHQALLLVATVYNILQPVSPFLWLLYCLEHLPHFRMSFGRRLVIMGFPLAIVAFLAMASPVSAWLFSVDEFGRYHRGPWVGIAIALPFIYISLAMLVTLIGGRSIPLRIRRTLLGFAVLPFGGAVIQVLVFGVSVIWPAISLSLLMIYLGVESDLLALDYLTGLQNRRSLNRFLQRRLRDYQAGRPLGGLMIDINDFKKINDQFGHTTGDQALEEMAHVLRNCFHHQDFIARYGGDEFVVILELRQQSNLEVARNRLLAQLDDYNRHSGHAWKLEISIGAQIYLPGGKSPIDEVTSFLDAIDSLMYRDKPQRESSDAACPERRPPVSSS